MKWRLVPPDDSLDILQKLSELTSDPNFVPPLPSISDPGATSLHYRPRISPGAAKLSSQVLLIMLRDFGPLALPSGFIVSQSQGSHINPSDGPIWQRKPVVFKNSCATIDPADLKRFVVCISYGTTQFDRIPNTMHAQHLLSLRIPLKTARTFPKSRILTNGPRLC